MCLSSDTCRLRSDSGFTLVEMAVAMIVIGLVMLTVLPAVTALRMNSQRSVTDTNLKALMQATAVYAQANGCLPCPTPASTVGNGFGRVRGDSSPSPLACSGCPVPEGIPPFMSLGIPSSTAHDGGGHWITMRVDPELTTNFSAIPPAAACQCSDFIATNLPLGCNAQSAGTKATPGCVTLGVSQKGMCQASLSTVSGASPAQITTPGNAVAQKAAVIFVSHGVHGFGSFVAAAQELQSGANGSPLPFPSGYASCSAGNYAACNSASNSGTGVFYDATPSGGSNPYDDTLAFADRNTLVSMFGNGSCQTVW